MVLTMVPVLNGWAQTDVDTLAHRLLDDVEVTAHAPSSDVTSPAPTRSIDRERMQRLGLTALPDALRQLAGVTVRDYGGIGGLKTVSVRNLGAHHTAVSYDGLVVSNTQAGQIDLSHYQLDNVSCLSMAVGQADALLLSARHYASAGVVTITTDEVGGGGAVSIRGGSFGYVSPSLRYRQRLGQTTALCLDGSLLRADGDYPFTLHNGSVVTRERRLYSDVEAWQGEANLRHAFADGARLHVKVQAYHSERGLPGGVILYNKDNRERLWDENYVVQALYQRPLGKALSMAARLRYDHAWNRYEDVNVKYAGGRQVDLNHQTERYASVSVAWQPMRTFGVALAEDVAYGTLRNNIYVGADPERWTSLTALSVRYLASRLTLDAHLVGTLSQDRISRSGAVNQEMDSRRDHRRLSPALSASWRVLPGKALYLRAMMKHTFRLPSFNDLYYRRFGTVSLRPEQARMYGLGVTWSGTIYNKVYVEATADGYLSHVDDKIVAFPSAYVWRMMNFGRVDMSGLETSVQARWPLVPGWNVDVTGSYTLQRAVDKTDPQRSYYDQQLPYTPRHCAAASAIVQTPWLSLGYSMQACGERYSAVLHNADNRMKPYAEHNITLSRDFRLRWGELGLSASVMNLADTQFDIIQFYPMPGRHWQAGVTLKF